MADNNILQMAGTNNPLSLLLLIKTIEQLKDEKKRISEMAARSILKALDLKDHYTFGHSMRVAYYSLITGRELGLSLDELYQLEMSGIFHDIGKISVPDAILNKPGPLSNEEIPIMKSHPEKSAEILEGFSIFENVAIAAKHHHERFDGRGYPYGLKGDEIPFFSRIVLISDTFDAMTSTRSYRKGLSHKIAFDELHKYSGQQFDPDLVKYFIWGMEKEDRKREETFHLDIMNAVYDKNAA